MQHFHALHRLFRANLSAAVSLTALAGYLHCAHGCTAGAVAIFAGVFLLAASASALNQLQERASDSRMERTAGRPLPLRDYTRAQVLLIAAASGVAGLVLLGAFTTVSAAALGLFNLAWYNAVYTPLKKRTGYAFLVGALCGALPPVIGCLAVGAEGCAIDMALVALFMYVWQVPHFLLILHKHRAAYSAGSLPVPHLVTNERHVRAVVFLTFVLDAAIALLFAAFGVVQGSGAIAALVAANASAVAYLFVVLVWPRRKDFFRPAFIGLSVYQLMVLGALVV